MALTYKLSKKRLITLHTSKSPFWAFIPLPVKFYGTVGVVFCLFIIYFIAFLWFFLISFRIYLNFHSLRATYQDYFLVTIALHFVKIQYLDSL